MKLQHSHFSVLLLFLSIQVAESCIDSSGISCLWYFWFCLFWVGIGIFVIVVCAVNKCQQRLNRVEDIFLAGYKFKFGKKEPDSDVQVTIDPTDNPKGNEAINSSPFPSKSALSPSCEQTDQASSDVSPTNHKLLHHEQGDNTDNRTDGHITQTSLLNHHVHNELAGANFMSHSDNVEYSPIIIPSETKSDMEPVGISVQPFAIGHGEEAFVAGQGAFQNTVYHGQMDNSHTHSGYMEYPPMVNPNEPVPVCVEPNVKLTEASLNHYSDVVNNGYKDPDLSLVNKHIIYCIPNSPPPSYPGTPDQAQLDKINGVHLARYPQIDTVLPNINSDMSQRLLDSYPDQLIKTEESISPHHGINEIDRLVIIPNNTTSPPQPEDDLIIMEDTTDLSEPQAPITEADDLITMQEDGTVSQPVPYYDKPDDLTAMQEDNTNVTHPVSNYNKPDTLVTMQESVDTLQSQPNYAESPVTMAGDKVLTMPLPDSNTLDNVITMEEDLTMPLHDYNKPDHLTSMQNNSDMTQTLDITECDSHPSDNATVEPLLTELSTESNTIPKHAIELLPDNLVKAYEDDDVIEHVFPVDRHTDNSHLMMGALSPVAESRPDQKDVLDKAIPDDELPERTAVQDISKTLQSSKY